MFGSERFEMMLSGSFVNFKKREHIPLSEEEQELKLENQRKLQTGIDILRKLKTCIFEEQDPVKRQNIFIEAHQFSSQMAEVILNQALDDKPSPTNPLYLEKLQELKNKYDEKEPCSGQSLPPQFSIQNLFKATDDMLIRVEEKAQSFKTPDHKLTMEEMKYVLKEFVLGTNDLSINTAEKFFEKDTKVGGILSGGSVYLELVKKVIEKYGDSSLKIDTFVIAVDKENKKVAVETNELDVNTKTVILIDDMINRGGTMTTALWRVGEYFPNAIINSGKGMDHAGGFERRRIQEHMGHLTMIFQDFADFSEEGKYDEAMAIYKQAEEYAKKNNITLQRGWFIRKEKIETAMKKEK